MLGCCGPEPNQVVVGEFHKQQQTVGTNAKHDIGYDQNLARRREARMGPTERSTAAERSSAVVLLAPLDRLCVGLRGTGRLLLNKRFGLFIGGRRGLRNGRGRQRLGEGEEEQWHTEKRDQGCGQIWKEVRIPFPKVQRMLDTCVIISSINVVND